MKHDYRYISKNDPMLKEAFNNLMQLLQEVRKDLKAQYTFRHKLIGSCARNMVTYDAKSNVGFDFDVNIFPNDDEENFSPKEIKCLFKQALDRHCKDYGFDPAEDSTRVLTIKVKDRIHSRVVYSADLAFVNDYVDADGNKRQQYIRFNKKQNRYVWALQPNVHSLEKKIRWIKDRHLWESGLKPYYLEKKNKNDDPNMHSRSIFAAAVNEICQKNGYTG